MKLHPSDCLNQRLRVKVKAREKRMYQIGHKYDRNKL
jgi:hypothetical protein